MSELVDRLKSYVPPDFQDWEMCQEAAERINQLEVTERRLIRLLEHFHRASGDMLDPERRRGPGYDVPD